MIDKYEALIDVIRGFFKKEQEKSTRPDIDENKLDTLYALIFSEWENNRNTGGAR